MNRKSYLTIIITLITVFSGIVGANPKGSDHHGGIAGRSFFVMVQDLWTAGEPFENCYTFNKDGSWDDPAFPVPGTWNQTFDRRNKEINYTATALLPVGGNLAVLLTQTGTVKRKKDHHGRPSGKLHLDAFNTVELVMEDDPSVILETITELTSVGREDKHCAE